MKNQSISIKYGIFIGVFLIIYFIILGSVGAFKAPIYSIINIVICAVGTFMALNELNRNNQLTSETAFKTAFKTGIYGALIFTIFIAIFAALNNGNEITETIGSIKYLQVNYFLKLLIVFVPGVITAYIIAYLLTRYFRRYMPEEQPE